MNAPQHPNRAGRTLAAAVACLLLLGACGSDSDDEAAPDDTAEIVDEGTGTSTGDEAEDEGEGEGDPGVVDEGQQSDLCDRFTAEDFEAVTGVAAAPPEGDLLPSLPSGVLATCDHQGADIVPMISVTFHESSNWDDFVTAMSDSSESLDVKGGTAFESEDLGFYFQPDGEAWYLQILAVPGADQGLALGAYSTDLALDVLDVVMEGV